MNNLTPKPKDLAGQPGLREPGLSTLEHLAAKEKGIKIDLALLRLPLQAFADDPSAVGRPGHVSIAPIDDSGKVDLRQLREWVDSRQRNFDHPFTQIVLDAVLIGKYKRHL